MYKHGIYTMERETSVSAPVNSTAGLQVIIGTAPVNQTEKPEDALKPVLCHSFEEAVKVVGYSEDFESYTLCQSIYASFVMNKVAPIILINVLDPEKHTKALSPTEVPVTDHKAVLKEKGVLKKALKLKATGSEGQAITEGTDYELSFDNMGNLVINLLPAGKAYSEATVYVESGNRLDPSMVTYSDIVGTASGNSETGIKALRQIYPKFNMTAGIISAPGWSHFPTVATALQGATKSINGTFSAFALLDLYSANGLMEGETPVPYAENYSEIKEKKEMLGAISENAALCWPMCISGSKKLYMSAVMGAVMQRTDADNGDVPSVSPSNKACGITGTVLKDGTQIVLDQMQANTVNSYGVVTSINMNGFRLWGNNTCVYPAVTDVKDRFISVKRAFVWAENSFVLSYTQKVDNPMNPRLIENLVDSENIKGNALVAAGHFARYEIEYRPEENPMTDILNGKITFHENISPFTPAENIHNIFEFDPQALKNALMK